MKTKIFEQGGGARWKIKHLLFFVKLNFDRRRLDSNKKKIRSRASKTELGTNLKETFFQEH